MSECEGKKPVDSEARTPEEWEAMRLDYLGHVTELVGSDPPGKVVTTAGHEGPLPKSKSPGSPV